MEYLKNPFKINEGKVKEVFKERKGSPFELANVATGEVNYYQKISKRVKVIVDTSNYTKIYKGNTGVIYKLSYKGLLLFHYVADNLGIHIDTIILDFGAVSQVCKMSESSFYRAVSELLEKNIIARKKGSSIEFFVNINYVFNGSRLKVKS